MLHMKKHARIPPPNSIPYVEAKKEKGTFGLGNPNPWNLNPGIGTKKNQNYYNAAA